MSDPYKEGQLHISQENELKTRFHEGVAAGIAVGIAISGAIGLILRHIF